MSAHNRNDLRVQRGAWLALLALAGCGGARQASFHADRRVPESCADEDRVATCKARIDALTDALAETVTNLGTQSAQSSQSDVEAAPSAGPAEQQMLNQSTAASERPQSEPSLPPATPGYDCSAAHELRDRICELAAAICELSARNAPITQLATQCRDARERCERAKKDVAGPCP